MMALVFALIEAVLHPQSEAEALQRALDEQKRLDLFEIQCQTCGGLGVIADLSAPVLVPCDCPNCHGPECGCIKCLQALVMGWTCTKNSYHGKRCPECDGLGSPRG